MDSPEKLVVIIIGVIILAVVVVVVLILRNSKLSDELDALESRVLGSEDQIRRLQKDNAALTTTLKDQVHQFTGWLETSEHHRKAAEEDLKSRPRVERRIYRILTVGMKATGKSSLTLKWANPLVDLGTIEGTKMERYERTVSQVKGKESLTEHIFEVYDWGGEHIVDAQEQLVTSEINGILMVVDLGGRDAREVDERRIAQQLDEFNPHTLQYFLTPKIVTSCKTIVLFINKSDLISSSPAQAEAEARHYYSRLIQSLQAHASNIDVKVMVGSASFGHSTHLLFSHFVEQILPESAYDHQLLQRIKGAEPRRRTQTKMNPVVDPDQPPPGKPPAQAPPPPPNARVVPSPPARNMPTVKLPQQVHADDSGNGLDMTTPYPHARPALPAMRKG